MTKENNSVFVNIRLTPSLATKLRNHTETNDIKVSQLVRKLLTSYLN